MKKLLLIFLLFFAAKSFAQYPAIQNLGNDSTLIRIGATYNGGIKGGLINMTVADTTAANLLRIKAYPGAMIFTTNDGNAWIRNLTATGWILFGGGTSPSGSFWRVGGNEFPITIATRDIGTGSFYGGAVGIMTNGIVRAIIPNIGFTLSNDTTNTKVFTYNPTSKEWGYANWNNGGGGATPTLQEVLDADRNGDSIYINNGASGESYAIRNRNISLGFPVITLKPVTTGKNVAFDIMPTGTPGDYSNNGIAWVDVCDADISAGAGNTGAARVGITSTAVQFGSRAFGTTVKPVQLIVDTDARVTLNTNNTATFNIGKITQSQSVSGDYVGYTLLNTNNSVAESNPIFFLGQDFAALRFGYFRWNNGATSSGLRLPNQLEIASNTAGGVNGGMMLAALGNSGKIRLATGNGYGGIELAVLIDSTNFVGINNAAPVAPLDVTGVIRNSSHIEMADISAPSTPSSGYGRMYVNGDSLRFKNDAGTEFTLGRSSGSGGTPGGSNKQIQYNNSSAFAGSANLTQETNQILVTGTSTSVVPFAVKQIAAQSSNTAEFQNSSGTNLVSIGVGGQVVSVQNITAFSGASEQVQIGYTNIGFASIAFGGSSDTYLYKSSAGRLRIYTGSTDGDLTARSVTWSGRVLQNQGADVASAAGTITLGSDGNSFEITGTSAITRISNTNWQNGSEVTLLFTSTASLTDGTANSGTDIGMELAGNTNFTGSAGATLTLILSEIGGTQRWREKCRSVN